MTTLGEIEDVVSFYNDRVGGKDLVIYACASGCPAAYDDLRLREVERLRESYEGRVKELSFSGHHLGVAGDVASLALAARWIERRFTLDRARKGANHATSRQPDGMGPLARELNHVEAELTFKPKDLLDIEGVQRQKLNRLSGVTAAG